MYSPLEEKLVANYLDINYPMPEQQPDQAAGQEPSLDGVQLAMGGNAAGRKSDRPISDVPMALFDMGAGVARGAVAQTVGLPGDLQSIYNGLKSVFNRPEDQSRIDAFLKGMEEKTFLPTTERMGEILPPVVPAGAPDAKMRQGSAAYGQAFGELAPLPGAIEAGTAAVKAGTKALAPKAGEMILNGMEKLGTPVKMNAVPDGVGGAVKATAPVSDTGFYSAVEQAALNIQRKSGSGQAFLNDITKGENVKADEIKWIGLDEFLKGKKNVTKQEVQDYIAANKVDVQEVQLSDASKAEGDMKLRAELSAMSDDELADATQRFDFNNPNFRQEAIDSLMADRASYFDGHPQDAGAGVPRYTSYQLPGGENYREILLTMPAKQRIVETAIPEATRKPTVFKNSNGRFELLDEMGEVMSVHPTQEAADKAVQDWAKPFTKTETVTDPTYESSHWDEPNVLAHIRVNDRVDADGKKMLLVEEVQSDWHQAGRDKGYRNDADLEKKFAELTQQHREIVSRRADIVATPGKEEEYKALAEQEAKLIDEMNKLHDTKQYGVPDAPMKDTWYQLALKRVLKYAADNGYERVGLTTGERQVERYDLSKLVDAVSYHPDDRGRGMMLNVFGKNNEVIYSKLTPEDKVAGVIGKEAAKKLLATDPVDDNRVLQGLDLKIGGKGMRKYYDEVYPQFLDKYAKKWNAKVGETTIETGRSSDAAGIPSMYKDKEPIRYVDITPEMRQGVGKGQPLFSAAGAGSVGVGATMQDKEQK